MGQLAYAVSHNRKAASHLTGTGRFDGGIQGQQVGLIGNVLDHLDNLIDGLGLCPQGLSLFGRLAHDVGKGKQFL